MKNNFFYSISALLFAFALIAGCGGGGGGGSSNPVVPETSTTTSTSTSTASETATSTATNTGSDTATSTETSTGTGTSTSTETSTDTGTDTDTDTDTGTGTETSTITWTNVSSKNDIIGKWQNDREYKVDGGDVEKTWKDIGNGVPAIEFTSDEIEGIDIDIDGVYLSWPSKSKTVYYDKESVASDSTEIWTIDASENLDTYYIIDISLSKLNYIIIDPTTSQYKIIPYNIGITSDNGDNYIKLYDDIRPDYLILKKLP
ncbi:MAG: hypothetical protein BWY02_02427 [bacterium ADurb.Bin157]|nr:MAG: hypothetical protein BWY02_02427 [bacterium ADurb.Bin157]